MHAGVAQLVERLLCKQDVGSSSLSSSTNLVRFVYRLGLGIFIPARGVRLPYRMPQNQKGIA